MGKQNLADGDWTGKLSEEVLIEFGTMVLTPDVLIVTPQTESRDTLPDPPLLETRRKRGWKAISAV